MTFPAGYPFAQLAGGNEPLQLLDNVFAALGVASNIMCTASGTANGIVLTPQTNFFLPTSYTTGLTVEFVAVATPTGPVTLQITGQPSLPAFISPSSTVQVTGSAISAGGFYVATFNQTLNSGIGGWFLRESSRFTSAIAIDDGQGTMTQGRLVGMFVTPFNTANDNMPGTNFSLLMNIAAAGDFSNTLQFYQTAINYDETFNGGGQAFFWNPTLIPIGQDGTTLFNAQNFTMLAKHRLVLDRPQVTQTIVANSVTTATVVAQPPYPYLSNQQDIRVTIFQSNSVFVQGYAVADVNGAVGTGGAPTTGWYTQAGNPGGPKLLPTAAIFTGTVNIFLQPPVVPNATITFTAPSTWNWTTHNRNVGDPVEFLGGGAPTGLTAGTIYWVIATGLVANSFQVAATPGGAAVTFSGSGTGPFTGYAASVRFDGGPAVAVARNVDNPGSFRPAAGARIGSIQGTVVGPLQWTLADGVANYAMCHIYAELMSAQAHQCDMVFATNQSFSTVQGPDTMRLGQGLRMNNAAGVSLLDQGYGTISAVTVGFFDGGGSPALRANISGSASALSIISSAGNQLALGITNTSLLFVPSAINDLPANAPTALSTAVGTVLGVWSNRTPSPGDSLGSLDFFSNNSTPIVRRYGRVLVTVPNVTAGSEEGLVLLATRFAGTADQQSMFVHRGNTVVTNGSALATGATDGFLYIPVTNNVTPTGTPTNEGNARPMVWRNDTHTLFIWDGAVWRSQVFT